MSTTNAYRNPDPGTEMHICVFVECPGDDRAEAWHQQRILALIHSIKQAATQKKYEKALEHAHELGAHRAYAPNNLVKDIEEAVQLIPANLLEDGAD